MRTNQGSGTSKAAIDTSDGIIQHQTTSMQGAASKSKVDPTPDQDGESDVIEATASNSPRTTQRAVDVSGDETAEEDVTSFLAVHIPGRTNPN